MMQLLDKPLPDLAAWTVHFAAASIPVAPQTVIDIAELREDEDSVNAHDIAPVILRDPLMTVKLFAHISSRKRTLQLTEIESVSGCIIMMGVPPFFRTFSNLAPYTAHLQNNLTAQNGLQQVFDRAVRAAGYALGWAVRRQDLDAEAITIATLLHDIAEMLLWCHAPKLAMQIGELQKMKPGLRSSVAQRALLGIDLNDLERALFLRWNLPSLLLRMVDDKLFENPQLRNVRYAVDLARHSAIGWDNAALPDDYRHIGDLVHLPAEEVRRLVDPNCA
jgi:HD-like signal output (HDOD) protein